MSGKTSYFAGKAAEEQVARLYCDHGHRLLSRRWRGRAGEVDLILEKDGELVFVEVKKSKSFGAALQHLTKHQIQRLLKSAEDCLGYFPRLSLTPMRFDVALVDATGRIDIVPNALQA